jgi:hypothetical protein
MPVEIRVVAEGDVETVFETDQACHGIRRRTVHPDLAVMVHGHETESRVGFSVHEVEIYAVAQGNVRPVCRPGASQGIRPELEP